MNKVNLPPDIEARLKEMHSGLKEQVLKEGPEIAGLAMNHGLSNVPEDKILILWMYEYLKDGVDWEVLGQMETANLHDTLINTFGYTEFIDPDPESMSDEQKAYFWEQEYRKLADSEEKARKELANLLADPVCPATWGHIIDKVKKMKSELSGLNNLLNRWFGDPEGHF